MEFWNFGILEFWNFGILEFWNFGISEFWNFGILELWNFGISNQKSKIPKNPVIFLEIPKFQNSKIPKFQKKSSQFFGISIDNSLWEFWKFQKIDWIFLEFWNFGILEFWNFGILEFWNFGISNQKSKIPKNPVIFLEIPKFQNSKKIQSIFWNFQNSQRELTIGIPKK